jgi:hypothetical protein
VKQRDKENRLASCERLRILRDKKKKKKDEKEEDYAEKCFYDGSVHLHVD